MDQKSKIKNQKSKNNKIRLGKLVEKYSEERKELSGIGGNISLLSRFFQVNFKRRSLLNQEEVFQNEMLEAITKIIEENKLTPNHLREYSHALKTLTKKYSNENTHFLLVGALIILIFSAVGYLLSMVPLAAILPVATFILISFTLIARIFINETTHTYEELILLIDEYLDSKKTL
jgi:hypothetical protein